MRDSTTATDLGEMFSLQRKFSELLGKDLSSLSDSEREEMTREFVLAAHAELSSLVSGVNFKGHVEPGDISRSRILYEGVDVVRYVVAIMNAWNITDDEFMRAYRDKDDFLIARQRQNQTKWDGRPVIIVDMDDIIASFRKGYGDWLLERHGIVTDFNSKEYYFVKELSEANVSPTDLFEMFIADRQLRNLAPDTEIVDALAELRRRGVWVHILTARPEDNLTCKYDTYSWLASNSVEFDRISFAPEKFIWLSKSQYYREGKVVAAIDDSEKHVLEYSKHGVTTICPVRSYNTRVLDCGNVIRMVSGESLVTDVLALANMNF